MTRSLEILERLIAFDTVSNRSNLDLIAFVEDFLRARQFRVHRIPDLTEAKAGLYAEIGPQTDGGVLLSAHSDVVPVDGQVWTRPPFQLTRDGDRFFGRGTTDMKGFLAEMLAIADDASGKALKAPLKVLISYDEEVGCVAWASQPKCKSPSGIKASVRTRHRSQVRQATLHWLLGLSVPCILRWITSPHCAICRTDWSATAAAMTATIFRIALSMWAEYAAAQR